MRLSTSKGTRRKECKRVKKAYVNYGILPEETNIIIGIPEERGRREQKLI